jgi:hypothetical protein
VIRTIERLGDGREPTIADLDLDSWIGEQVRRPSRVLSSGDEHRAVRFVDVADRDGPGQAAAPASGRDPCDLPLEEQVAADVVRRQRARCQDFPSVWVDGA